MNFFPTNDFSLIEGCQLYIIAHHKTSKCCKIEAAIRRCSVKKCVLTIFAKLTGKPLCLSLFFIKIVGLRPGTLIKTRLWHSCFPVDIAKFLRTPFL